jgi:hypothetical protein
MTLLRLTNIVGVSGEWLLHKKMGLPEAAVQQLPGQNMVEVGKMFHRINKDVRYIIMGWTMPGGAAK